MIILTLKIEEMKEQSNHFITLVNTYAKVKRKNETYFELKKENQIRDFIKRHNITYINDKDYIVDFNELKKQINKNKRGNK